MPRRCGTWRRAASLNQRRELGRITLVSGQITATPGSEGAPKDVAGQATLATASLAAALQELEASAQDIVMMRVYVVNATTEAFHKVLSALRGLLGDAKPTMTTIGVQALYTPEILVEIEMAVHSPDEAKSFTHIDLRGCRRRRRR